MKERFFDELLNIKTEGDQTGFNKSLHYHRYEATPYNALERLFDRYELTSSNRIVDFGCGKGRLAFYVHYLYEVSVIGVEMNETFYEAAVENRKNYLKKAKNLKGEIDFYRCFAEEYQIDPLDNRFYFFNPFSIQIFMKIINNILISVEKSKRDIELIFYYASEDYIYFLENYTSFELNEEMILSGLYNQNPYEKFLVYGLTH